MNVSFSVAVDSRFQTFAELVKLGIALDLVTRGPVVILAADHSWFGIWQIILYSQLTLIGFAQIIVLLITKLRPTTINPQEQLTNAKTLLTEFITNVAHDVAQDVASDVAHDVALQA